MPSTSLELSRERKTQGFAHPPPALLVPGSRQDEDIDTLSFIPSPGLCEDRGGEGNRVPPIWSLDSSDSQCGQREAASTCHPGLTWGGRGGGLE